MHTLWNTNYQIAKYYGEANKCPLCLEHREDMNHVFYGPAKSARSYREKETISLVKDLEEANTPIRIYQSIIDWLEMRQDPNPGNKIQSSHLVLHEALTTQKESWAG